MNIRKENELDMVGEGDHAEASVEELGKSYFNDLLKFSSPAPLDGTVGLVLLNLSMVTVPVPL